MATDLTFLGFEPQFIDHVAPVYHALGRPGPFLVDASLVDHARYRNIDPTPVDTAALRRSTPPPEARPGPGPVAFAASIGDIKAGRRLGFRRFAFIEHGIGQAYNGVRGAAARHPSYAGGMDREDVELFLVPNDYSADLWRRAYPDARVEVVGCPRLDDLPRRVPGPPTIAISFHWPAPIAPEAGTAFGHFRTALAPLAARYRVIGHGHPKWDLGTPGRLGRYFGRYGIEFVPDFDDVCRRADLYICDNSSTIYEFAATGRPVVVLNAPDYRRHVDHGLRFWEAADVGPQVDGPADLRAAIDRALELRPDDVARREAALDIVYAHRTGAASRAAAAVDAWLAPTAVAA